MLSILPYNANSHDVLMHEACLTVCILLSFPISSPCLFLFYNLTRGSKVHALLAFIIYFYKFIFIKNKQKHVHYMYHILILLLELLAELWGQYKRKMWTRLFWCGIDYRGRIEYCRQNCEISLVAWEACENYLRRLSYL